MTDSRKLFFSKDVSCDESSTVLGNLNEASLSQASFELPGLELEYCDDYVTINVQEKIADEPDIPSPDFIRESYNLDSENKWFLDSLTNNIGLCSLAQQAARMTSEQFTFDTGQVASVMKENRYKLVP